MKLFQYWDTGEPPADVAGWIESVRVGNPELKHRLYDRASSSWFIGKHFGERERQAFEACAVPAMQADYFRLCALVAKGGVWIDADTQCLAPLGPLLVRAAHGVMMTTWNGGLANGLMMFRQPADPFLSAALKLATETIEERRFDTVSSVSGPGLLNAVRAAVEPGWAEEKARRKPWFSPLVARAVASMIDPAGVLASIHALTLIHFLELESWMNSPQAAYKATPIHWTNWTGPIYAEPVSQTRARDFRLHREKL